MDHRKFANQELKRKYVLLLSKHRQRYHSLLRKYKSLEEKMSDRHDIGSPQQVIRDSRKYLSEDHVLFLESQMFLKNRNGNGNRFSKRFMKLMIEYFKRSAAGYRYLRTIFTIPSVKTVQNWMNRPLDMLESDPLDMSGAGTSEQPSTSSSQAPKTTTSQSNPMASNKDHFDESFPEDTDSEGSGMEDEEEPHKEEIKVIRVGKEPDQNILKNIEMVVELDRDQW